jgi:hypothetical protein
MNDDFERALAHEQNRQAELFARLAQLHQPSTLAELQTIHGLTEQWKAARVACSRAAERLAAH